MALNDEPVHFLAFILHGGTEERIFVLHAIKACLRMGVSFIICKMGQQYLSFRVVGKVNDIQKGL